MRHPLLLLAGLALLAGCDAASLDDFVPEVAISAVLEADSTLPLVYLSLTGPIDEPYDPLERAIRSAEVAVSLLRPDGTVEVRYDYRDLADFTGQDSLAGIYAPPGVRVLAERRYRLEAVVPGFDAPVTAETTVPRAFEIVRPPPDTVAFQQGDPPGTDVTPSGVGGAPSVYVFTVTALEPSVEALTPFAADLFFDRDVEFENFVETSSPLLNEGNYDRNADGTIRIEAPWFAFNFFGANRIRLTALDPALQTFLEFQAIQFVPTTISPGEIPNVPTNVQNGVGVFGAVAQATTSLVVARP